MKFKQVGDYKIVKTIGKGNFGEVFEVEKNGQRFAMKKIPRNISNKAYENIGEEIGLLKNLNHSNIIQLKDRQKTRSSYYLVYELCNGGDLHQFVNTFGALHERSVRMLIKQFVDGYVAINSRNYIHRDIKLANILLHFPNAEDSSNLLYEVYNSSSKKFIEEPVVKIADFGFIKRLEDGEEADTLLGTPFNLPPELWKCEKYGYKADVWCLGTIIFELLTGRPVKTADSLQELKFKILTEKINIPTELNLTAECIDFLSRCLKLEPEDRMELDDIVSHPFLQPLPDVYDPVKFSLVESEYCTSLSEIVDEETSEVGLGTVTSIKMNMTGFLMKNQEIVKGLDSLKNLDTDKIVEVNFEHLDKPLPEPEEEKVKDHEDKTWELDMTGIHTHCEVLARKKRESEVSNKEIDWDLINRIKVKVNEDHFM